MHNQNNPILLLLPQIKFEFKGVEKGPRREDNKAPWAPVMYYAFVCSIYAMRGTQRPQDLIGASRGLAKEVDQAPRPKTPDRKSTRLNSSHLKLSRMPSSA